MITEKELLQANGNSEFLRLVDGISTEQFLSVVDELVSQTIKIINPRLYDGVLQRLER